MKIPFMRLDRQFANHKSEFMAATESVLAHGRVLQGDEVAQVEQNLCDIFGVKNAVAVGSCTDALMFSLRALNLKENAKVAVTSVSFVASASSIVNAGGRPVFVDVDNDLMASEKALLGLIDRGEVAAVVIVHLYGQIMELKNIYEAARKNGVFLIEDCAQCIGATRHGYPAGRYSDAAAVSFDPTKVIGAFGSGGGVVTNNSDLAESIRRFRYHGHVGNRVFKEIGFNSQLASLQAAYINIKFKYMYEWQCARVRIADAFSSRLQNIPQIILPRVFEGNSHIYHKYVVRVVDGRREELIGFLKGKGIETSVHYGIPLHKQPCFEPFLSEQGELVNAEMLCKQVLSLPMYPELLDDEVNYICESMLEYYSS